MIKLLHTADLHLKAPPHEDSGYSLACLKVILGAASKHRVDAILFCGDIFDAPSDFQDNQFVEQVVATLNTSSAPILYIPGNHEDKSGKFEALKKISLGACVELFTDVQIRTFSKHNVGLEILCIPHRESYEGFARWDLPSKQSAHRIAIAHGELPGFTFLGDEEGAGVLNPSIFSHFQAAQVFLGHIHLKAKGSVGGIEFFYSGSPRTVRRSETGVRGVNLVEIEDEIEVKRIALLEVGVMRRISISPLENDWVLQVRNELTDASDNDRVKITLEGMVEDDRQIVDDASALEKDLQQKFRRVEIENHLKPIEDLIENPFFRQVYERWKEAAPEDKQSYEYRVWLQMISSLQFIRKEVLK